MSDEFVSKSLAIFLSAPTTAKTSIILGKKHQRRAKSKPEGAAQPAKVEKLVKFRTFDPLSGQVTTLQTNKSRVMNRLLTAIGPQGVQLGEKRADGFVKIMCNGEVPVSEEGAATDAPGAPGASASASAGQKKKKKKSKK